MSTPSKGTGEPKKSALEMLMEANMSKKTAKKTKAEDKTEAKSESAKPSGDSSVSGTQKLAKEDSDVKDSSKDKKQRRKSKKLDPDAISSEIGTPSVAAPVKDSSPQTSGKEGNGEVASALPSSTKTKSRPKSMMVASPKDGSESIEDSTGSASGKRLGEKKKSSKHMSVTPKAAKADRSVEDGDKPATPSKLKGPSRENSRSDLEAPRPASPSSVRRKSVGHTSARATVTSPASTGSSSALNKPPSVADLKTVSGAPSTSSATVSSTDASHASTSTSHSTTEGSNGSVDALGAHGRSASKVGEVRAMFEKKTSSSTTPMAKPTGSDPAPRANSTQTLPPVTAGSAQSQAAHTALSMAQLSPKSQDAAPTTTGYADSSSGPSSPNGPSDATQSSPVSRVEKRTLVKKTSEDSDSSSKSASSKEKISVSRDEYRKLKADMTHYRRGYDHWKSKYKDLEAAVTTVPGTAPAAVASDSIILARTASGHEMIPNSVESAEIAELKRQTSSLNTRNIELTAIMDALALKFKLTTDNIGLRLEALEVAIKKLQGEHQNLAQANQDSVTLLNNLAAAGTRASIDLTQLQAGARGSIGLSGSGGNLAAPGDGSSSPHLGTPQNESSPRPIPKRGISQKDFTSRRTNSGNLLKPTTPNGAAPASPSITSSGSKSELNVASMATPGSVKDVRAFWSSFLMDLTTLRRKVIVPLLSQPIESLDKRTRVVCEMLDTEQKYIFGIQVMITNWEKPLVSYAGVEPKIPLNELKSIFGDGWLQFMVANNIKYLCEKLEERLMNWTDQSTVGDIFGEFEPYLHPYKRYCSRYEESLRLLTNLAEANAKFKKALEYFDNHCFGFNGLRLRDYLITPVQRVPRYNLLLRDLLSCTPESHPDHALLTNALNKISTTASDINEGIRQAESQLKMREIAERGNGFENLTKGNQYRTHIKTVNVDVLVDLMDRRRGLPSKKPELLIFSDLIVSGAFVNKKSLQQEYAIPSALAWIISDLTESPEDLNPLLEGCPRQNAFLVRGPESLWLVAIKKQSDLVAAMGALQNVIGCLKEELANGRRNGRYEFLRLPGSYDGQWLDGEFHGAGVYVKTDGTLFDGHWDTRFKTGFGQITAGGLGQHVGGWKNLRPDADVAEYKDHQLWDSRTELTERDWAIFMTGAREVQYKRDQKVIEQGLPNTSLFKIKSGKCRVEKETAEGRVTLVTLPPGAYFGDTSVLPMMRTATADVIADTPTAEINVIEVSILFEILKTDPALAMRFFRQLARTLANRLRSLHQTPAAKAVTTDKKKEIASSAPPASGHGASASGGSSSSTKPEGEDDIDMVLGDNSYCDKFDLPPGEVVIKEVSAGLRGVIKKYGHLYLSQKFLCFEAHVFGMASREVIHLERVTKVELIKKKYILVQSKKSKFEFTVDNLDELYGLLSSMCVKPGGSDTLDAPTNSRLLHVEKSGDDTQTASSEDSRDHRGSYGGPSPIGTGHTKRRSTYSSLAVAEDTDTGSLTAGDWKLLQQGFQCITYAKDKPITLQGTTHLRMFQIARGKCRIEIKPTSSANGSSDAEAKPQVVGYLNTGALFGEISFLDGSAATASVIANDESVEVYVIEGYFINILFVKYPELAGRFFAYLAGVIAGRLSEREASRGQQDKKPKRTRTKTGLTTTTVPTPSVPQ
jgi:CRP-like cAMP-binding protein